VVSVHLVGDGAAPGKEGKPVKIASPKGLLRRGFYGLEMILLLLSA
jgi:hypothetical protein